MADQENSFLLFCWNWPIYQGETYQGVGCLPHPLAWASHCPEACGLCSLSNPGPGLDWESLYRSVGSLEGLCVCEIVVIVFRQPASCSAGSSAVHVPRAFILLGRCLGVLVALWLHSTSSSCWAFLNSKIWPLWEDVGQLEPGLTE